MGEVKVLYQLLLKISLIADFGKCSLKSLSLYLYNKESKRTQNRCVLSGNEHKKETSFAIHLVYLTWDTCVVLAQNKALIQRWHIRRGRGKMSGLMASEYSLMHTKVGFLTF